jgi:hypothetical protein
VFFILLLVLQYERVPFFQKQMSKTKTHFAVRVPLRTTRVPNNENQANAQKRAEVQAEINSHKINIDRSTFSKTQHEKDELKLAKLRWNNELRKKSA